MGWREAVKRVPRVPMINRPLTTALRSAGAARFDAVVSHLPRVGQLEVPTPGGRVLRLWANGDDFTSSQQWWRGWDAYEPETVRPWWDLACESQCILDIGAHVGWFALLAVAANPTAEVHAFEAHPDIAARAQRNAALNAGDITVVSAACSDEPGTVTLHLGSPDGLPFASSVAKVWGERARSIDVPAVTIDQYAASMPVDLVKIDVEGHEPAVLEGMRATIERCRPTIILELLHFDGICEAAAQILDGFGYRYENLTPAGRVPASHLHVPEDLDSRNWLALPPS